jgi:hypothetical protein
MLHAEKGTHTQHAWLGETTLLLASALRHHVASHNICGNLCVGCDCERELTNVLLSIPKRTWMFAFGPLPLPPPLVLLFATIGQRATQLKPHNLREWVCLHNNK